MNEQAPVLPQDELEAQAVDAAQRVIDGPQNPSVSAEEYQRGVTTGQFLDAATDAERQIDDSSALSPRVFQDEQGVSIDGYRGYGGPYSDNQWPDQRAMRVTRELAEIPGSGLDVDALKKVDELRDEASRINRLHDVVSSDGAGVEPVYNKERIERVLAGNNQVGHSGFGMHEESQQLGAMTRGAGRKYDIKDGVAMRGESTVNQDSNGNISGAQNQGAVDGKYKPFAPQHQEAAKKAMQSLADKQRRAVNEQVRISKVKEAKEALGRAGVKIPKPQPTDGEHSPQNAA